MNMTVSLTQLDTPKKKQKKSSLVVLINEIR